jgi:hypothetical protein
LPSVLPGIALIALLPLLTAGWLPGRAAAFATWLLAISPFLVFYSRYARPYSLVVLLSLVAITASYRWGISGRRRHLLLFLGSAVGAAWLHPLELRLVAAPLAYLFAVCLCERTRRGRPHRIVPSVGAIAASGVAATAFAAALFSPVFFRGGERLLGALAEDEPTLATLTGALGIFSGCAEPAVVIVLAALAGAGLTSLFARDWLLAGLLVTVVVADLASVLIAHPVDSELPHVTARYLIPLLPVFAISVAVGVDATLRTLAAAAGPLAGRAGTLLAAALTAVLFLLGPLVPLYAARDDFTNHKAYQHSYARTAGPDEQFRLYRQLLARGEPAAPLQVPAFYETLARIGGDRAIIEYPLPVGDRFLPFHVYQRLHGRRVLGGYLARGLSAHLQVAPGVAFANWPVDFVLGEVEPARLHLKSFVDIEDRDAMRRSGARFLVIHYDLAAELGGQGLAPGALPPGPGLWLRKYGHPIASDDWILVFDLGQP